MKTTSVDDEQTADKGANKTAVPSQSAREGWFLERSQSFNRVITYSLRQNRIKSLKEQEEAVKIGSERIARKEVT